MMQYIENLVGIENAPMASYIAMAVTALIVILILWLIIRLIRRPRFASSRRNKQARLAITDAATVDSKRRLVLLRRDDVEHLIMIGGPTDIIIETDIRRQKQAVAAAPVETAAPATTAARAPAKPVAAKPIAEAKPAPVAPPKPSVIPSAIPGVSKVGAAVGSLTGAATSAVSATANTASSAVSSTTSAVSSATDKLTDLALPEKKEPSIEDDMNALLDEISTPEVDPPKKA